MGLSKFERQVFFTTVRISVQGAESGSIGTGFIYNEPLGIEGHTGTFLVSNKHVFQNPSNKLILSFHVKDDATDTPILGKTIQVVIEDFEDFYYEHPDPEVDLACINISGFTKPEKKVFIRHLHSIFTTEFKLDSVVPGDMVLFVGYPEGRFDTVNNLPILRRGYVASMPEVNFNGREQIVIDAQVFPDSSGSPVFVILNGEYRLIGVVTQTMVKDQVLKEIPADFNYGVEQTIGLGIVLKTQLVLELVAFAAEKLTHKVLATHHKLGL